MSSTFDFESLNKQFSEYLRKKKYRSTQERSRVLERIADLDDHFSADDLYMTMNSEGERVSRATIYSTLDLLTQCNILVKHRFQGESAHFELSARMPHHDHLICNECGRVVEFQEPDIEDISSRVARGLGFTPVKHSLQIFATCHDPSTCEHNTTE